MRKETVYAVLSHYDAEGHKSRSVVEVKAEIIEHRGYRFAVYRNHENYDNDVKRKWIVLDVKSGMIYADGKTKQKAIDRITSPLFDKYEELIKTKSYEELCEQNAKMIDAYKWGKNDETRGNS